jgi:hypothetical protein
MTRLMRHRISRHGLTGIAAVLITMAVSICASAAISGGARCTNSALEKERRNTQFFRAQQSFQEQLKVGRERYDQKQVIRARVIQAMAEELQARQQTVVIHQPGDPDDDPGPSVLASRPLQAVVTLGLGSIGLAYYMKRLKLALPEARPQPKKSVLLGARPMRRRYRVTALKPVTICANVEVSKTERTLLGAEVRRTRDEPTWIQLRAGQTQDKLGVVVGVHPDCAPSGQRISLNGGGADVVPLEAWTDGDLPKKFFEVLKLEVSG